jgi:hypothetical protein
VKESINHYNQVNRADGEHEVRHQELEDDLCQM